MLFAALTIGTWFIIASACVINNYLDQDIDALMERTKARPLLTGEVTNQQAVSFGILLGLLGFALLISKTNWWVVGVGLFGWVAYVWLYGALGKRKSVHGTLVGALSGAAPILAGYVAVNPRLDWVGLSLFGIIFFWQMPEFYAISIYRREEYAHAGLPVSAVKRGVPATIRQIFAFTALTVLITIALKFSSFTSWTMWIVLLGTSIRWLQIAAEGLKTKNAAAWAKKEFHFALVFLVVFSIIIAINPYLP
jgi:protoheme IX farnesyltransferase